MAYSAAQLRRALANKLGFDADDARRHPTFVRWHEGRIIAKTHISHGAGRRDVSEGVVGAMARQLGVSGREFRAAVDCGIGADAFLALLLQRPS